MRVLIFSGLLLLTCPVPAALAQSGDSPFLPPTSSTFKAAPANPQVDYAGATWVPAAQGNFQEANRPLGQAIDMIVIHDIEGPASAALDIFQRPGSKVSSHYVVGADGTVYQMVREHDVAWHAGNSDINRCAVGIETHGYAYRPGFYSSTVYEAEAKLVRDITKRYNIPRDRAHIIGHAEVPNPRDPTRFGGVSGHMDPGPYWDWSTFLTLVRSEAHLESSEIPTTIHPGEKLPAAVTLRNAGDDAWTANKAPDPRLGLQSDAPVVFLGTDQGTPSAFSDLSGWMAPQYADAVKGADVAPGASARFEFALQGPRTLGEISEVLQAVRVPTIAQGGNPLPFGDLVPLKLSVLPWDIAVPHADAPSSSAPTGGPSLAPTSPIFAPPIPASSALSSSQSAQIPVAQWTIKLPIGGYWGVFVSPAKPAKARKKESFVYSLSGIEGEGHFSTSAKTISENPLFAGYYRFREPTSSAPTITVTLDKAPRGTTITNAGSLRLVGPFPTPPTQIPILPGSPAFQLANQT